MSARLCSLALAALAPLFVAACDSPAISPMAAAAGPGLLLVGSRTGVSAVEMRSGSMAFEAPPSALAPDRTRLIHVRSEGGATRVAAVEGVSGREQAAWDLDGAYSLGAISANGRHVALVADDPGGYRGRPNGRDRTILLILDIGGETSPRRIDLPGSIEPEAFSSDDRSLFVIDYLPPSAPDRYRVRRLDLDSETVAPVQTRAKLFVEEEMRGQSRQQVRSPDGKVLFTLYLQEDDHVHARDRIAAGGNGHPSGARAFVHVLHLERQWAFCLDLPPQFGPGPAGSHALAIAPDGRSLYVANWSSGSVAVADTDTFQLRHRAKGFPDESGGWPGVARAARGRLYLAGGDRLLAIDGATLNVVGRHRLNGPVSALELSEDERRLYVALPGEVAVIDPRTGRALPSLPFSAAEWLARVPRASAGGAGLATAPPAGPVR